MAVLRCAARCECVWVAHPLPLCHCHCAALSDRLCVRSSLCAGIAPGRVNLIGEHTDYNDGFVMPLAIDRHTIVIGRRNGMNKWRIVSGNAAAGAATAASAAAASSGGDVSMDGGSSSAPAAAAAPTAPVLVELDSDAMYAKYSAPVWHNYFRGVVAQFAAAGHAVPCFDVAIMGNVPLGGGLSSSASLEVACAAFLQALLQLPLDGIQRALWCQKCEHDFWSPPQTTGRRDAHAGANRG